MGTWGYNKGVFVDTWSCLRHMMRPRMTLRYPDQKLDLEGPGYHYDARQGVGLPGFKGRHILKFEKCTGCQLCAIACDGIAVAIEMQKVEKGKPQNKKQIWPAVDYGRCVPPETPIVTSEGIKPMAEIRVGDKVLTHTGRFRRVTKLFDRSYTGKLYTFKTRGNPVPLTTTDDHPILVYHEGEVTWSFANEIELGAFLTRPMLSAELSDKLGLDSSLYQGILITQSSRTAGSRLELKQLRREIMVSEVESIETSDVKDFLVQNLEVDEDNSYVAANQTVHNCVFCGLCVVPETEVMTNPGLKLISEISTGDRVLTHTGEYKPVTKVWEFTYSGTLYEIKALGKPEPLICTADHKIFAVRRPASNRRDRRLLRKMEPLEMVLPQNLKTGDYLVTPIPKRTISLDEVEVEFTGHYGTKTLILKAEPSLFRLIGFYLSEGSTHLDGRSVTLSFGSVEQDLIDDSKQLFTKYFSKDPVVQILRHHVANVRLGSSLALKFFVQFGRGAANKSLPDWVFFAGKEKQVQLIKGLFLGDGCVVNQSRQKYLNITTVSKVLASQIQLVLARLGVVSTIAKGKAEGKLPAYRVNVFGKWAVKLAELMVFPFDYSPTKSSDKFLISSDYVYSPIERIAVQNVSERTVMDVTVEGDHTFVGSGVVQHNCVDACPFDALDMTNDYELSAYDKAQLRYTPDMLAVPPKLEGKKYKVKFDTEKGVVTHG